MPRPITITEEMKQTALTDFAELLDGMKLSDGEIKYSKSFKYQDRTAIVWLTQEAYQKIVALVTGFSDEVAWHGSVTRMGDNEFIIEDIFVYPQTVTGSTVTTDQATYTKWLYGLDDDTFNSIRMQGHSHCNMGVSPSSVDDKHRQQILDQLEKDMFYIFMVWNKSLSIHTLIYDMQRNVLYEDKDVEVKLRSGGEMDKFMADAQKKVQKYSYTQKAVPPLKKSNSTSTNLKSTNRKSANRKPTNHKNKHISKKQKTSQFEHIENGSCFNEHDYCSLCGMYAEFDLEPIGCRSAYQTRFFSQGG